MTINPSDKLLDPAALEASFMREVSAEIDAAMAKVAALAADAAEAQVTQAEQAEQDAAADHMATPPPPPYHLLRIIPHHDLR